MRTVYLYWQVPSALSMFLSVYLLIFMFKRRIFKATFHKLVVAMSFFDIIQCSGFVFFWSDNLCSLRHYLFLFGSLLKVYTGVIGIYILFFVVYNNKAPKRRILLKRVILGYVIVIAALCICTIYPSSTIICKTHDRVLNVNEDAGADVEIAFISSYVLVGILNSLAAVYFSARILYRVQLFAALVRNLNKLRYRIISFPAAYMIGIFPIFACFMNVVISGKSNAFFEKVATVLFCSTGTFFAVIELSEKVWYSLLPTWMQKFVHPLSAKPPGEESHEHKTTMQEIVSTIPPYYERSQTLSNASCDYYSDQSVSGENDDGYDF